MDATRTPSPSAAAAYLRRLLERQPACLIRVRLDGVLLACNDAGLGLFGVRKLAAILNTNFADRIVATDLTKWQEFTARVWAKGAASLETYLAVENDIRPVLVQGIALKDHPGGVDSLLLHLRDQSLTHQLERSVRSAEISRAGQEERQRAARDQVEQAIVERMQLAAIADQHQTEHEAERHRLMDALEAEIADRYRREAKFVELESRVEESQLALLAKEREHRGSIATLEATLAALHAAQAINASVRDKEDAQREQEAAASAERHRQEVTELQRRLQMSTAEVARLGALVAEHEGQRKQMAAEHHAAAGALEQALARARDEIALGRDEDREVIAALRTQLSAASAEQSRLAARVTEHERERDRMIAEHRQALAELEAVKTLETTMGEALAALRTELSQASNEQGRLAARAEELERERGRTAEEHQRERDRMIAEHHRAIADLQTDQRDALSQLRAQLAQAFDEQSRLGTRAEEQEQERDHMIAAHHQALADVETSTREALAGLRAQLAQTTAEHDGLAARVEAAERERDRMSAEHHQALADLETSKREALEGLRAQLAQATAEHNGLAARVEAAERERDRMSAEHHQALADLETGKREALAGLRAQLAQMSSEQSDLTARIEEHEREHERMRAEHERIRAEHRRAIADLQTSKRETLVECERVLTEIQQELLARDEASAEIERRILEVIDEAAREKAAAARLAALERQAVETVNKAIAEKADRAPVVTETQTAGTDAEVFDAADASFVRHLIGIDDAAPKATEGEAPTNGQDPVFDAEDDTFVRGLIDRNHWPPEPPSPREDS